MYVEARKKLVAWLRRQMTGPAGEGILQGSPLDRYPVGVLSPVEPGISGVDPASTDEPDGSDPTFPEDEEEEALGRAGEDTGEARSALPARKRRYVPPSSVGFSCFVRGEARLCVTASAARYRHTGERDERGRFRTEYERTGPWRQTLVWPGSHDASGETSSPHPADIDVRARSFQDGHIFTITLSNRQEMDPEEHPRQAGTSRVEKSLFEVELECLVEAGALAEYPRIDPSLLTKEEQELELQYKTKRIYAIGHGAAVDWYIDPGRAVRLRTEFMPEVEVPQVTADLAGGDEQVLDLHYLAAAPWDGVLGKLHDFTIRYEDWTAGQRRAAMAMTDAGERAIAERVCERMQVALERMKRGIALLRSDADAAESFRLANQAMRDQMRQDARVRGQEEGEYRWRPFQLAFLLTVMESTIREADDFRDVLDLIWFPTGGGKTEAYLGLIAFLIVWRRLKYPDSGGGTVVLMRYTLRLLTRQQFERATRIIFALERLRRNRPDRLGEEPFRAGLWVGKAASPNTFRQALECVGDIRGGRKAARARLVVEGCPWCGTDFEAHRSYRATDHGFDFLCVNPECDFGGDGPEDPEPLPCNVVDEALYDAPPSLLIGTIDKFARLAWEERAGAFFGDRGSRPPELVIQDELHLITGPLGSVAGLYETALDTLLNHRGVHPKYIASTATIRMAREQVKRLYGRELTVFPPPGLSCDDSYFARTDHERPGRLYVGYLAPRLDRQHCLAPLAAALLMGPLVVFEDGEDREALLEAWWTHVIYHGSLRGVGNSHNAYSIDVRDFGRRLSREWRQVRSSGDGGASVEIARTVAAGDGDPEATEEDIGVPRIDIPQIRQLTSIFRAEENAETFRRLARRRWEEGHLDAVLATNMVSVGLDVARLAVMIVNGQPLTTAEYIQASSRVGRGDIPGLVFANYYRNQARSLSHYENFRPYHESFYRFVEPTSVTPYTFQVRSRALHAALVIALRHACRDLRDNKAAGSFNRKCRRVQAVVETLKRRCERADPQRAEETAHHIDRLVERWCDEAHHWAKEKCQLNYRVSDNEKTPERLLYSHDDRRRGLWPTLHSMRNVEDTGVLKYGG